MLVVAAIFIPNAEIYATPASKTETVTIDVSASNDQKTVDLSGAVPAYWQSITVEGRGQTPSSGETLIPRNTATGRVTFLNLTEEEIIVPSGTVVGTQNDAIIRFSTIEEAVIPVGSEGATLSVEALQPGSSGNVPAETIVAIEGPLGLNLSVTNRRSTSGGSDYTAATPNEVDYQTVYNQLSTSLEQTAQNEFEFNAAPGDVFLSTSAISQQVLEENYMPEIGEPADNLNLNLRMEFQFPYAAEADLHQLGRIVLDRHIDEDYAPRPETLHITQLTKPVPQEAGQVTWKIQASWRMGARLDETEAVSLIIGLSPQQASQQLTENTPIAETAEIRMYPEWWPRLPVLPFRIKLINLLETAPVENPDVPFSILNDEK
jgi:hypothetical protein